MGLKPRVELSGLVFFEDMDDRTAGASLTQYAARHRRSRASENEDATSKREALMLVRAYYTIRKEKVRRQILELAPLIGLDRATIEEALR